MPILLSKLELFQYSFCLMLLQQCAVVGFVTAFLVNIWYVVDKFVKGNPTPSHLPLSTQGCPTNYTTTVITTTSTTTPTTLTTALMGEVT